MFNRNRIRQERDGYEWARTEIENGVQELQIGAHVDGSCHPFDVGAKRYLRDLGTKFPAV